MDVPIARRDRDRQSEIAQEQRQPCKHGQRREHCRRQEERTKAVTEEDTRRLAARAGNIRHGEG